MDMIVLFWKETIIRNLFCSCCFEENLISEMPIGPAQSQHSTTEKMHCKTNLFSIAVLTLRQVNVKWESRNNRRGTSSHWRCSGEVGFQEIALSKLFAVKSALKSLKNNRERVYFLQNCISPTVVTLLKIAFFRKHF